MFEKMFEKAQKIGKKVDNGSIPNNQQRRSQVKEGELCQAH